MSDLATPFGPTPPTRANTEAAGWLGVAVGTRETETETETENENAFAKCAFCPAEGHVACVFADARDDACAVCARGRDCALSQQKTAGPGARAPPSPAGVRRAFPRRVPDRVRRALESDDEDAWRLE